MDDTLNHNLRSYRRRARLSMGELAAAAGVSRQIIGYIEAGHTPTFRVQRALAAALNCDVAELFPLPEDAIAA